MAKKHWYDKRKNKDAPSYVHDQAHTPESIWATGYNDAIDAYLTEVNDLWWEEIGKYGDRRFD